MLNVFTPNTKIQSSQENANWSNFSNHGRNFTIVWPFAGTLITQTSNSIISLPDNATINRVDLQVAGAPTGAAVIVDILKGTNNNVPSVTIFTNQADRPQIAINGLAGNTTTIDVATVTKLTDTFAAEISQIGSTVAGNDLNVMMRGQYNLD